MLTIRNLINLYFAASSTTTFAACCLYLLGLMTFSQAAKTFPHSLAVFVLASLTNTYKDGKVNYDDNPTGDRPLGK